MTSSVSLLTASLPRDKAFLHYALRVHQLLMGETPKTALVHHLSRYTAATMHPRQTDNFTGNFFPPESLGTNASKILYPLYVRDFTDTTNIPVSNPISQVVKVLLCANLQQFLARFLALESII
ncbi:MAG: hypothetical protein QNJ41_08515 [Xenococcaceae cyanobacterium MO_188.B32]|nr:hypothetical protein [Xenococcaceae cyanobacterium MO_188.B32]